MLGQGLATVTVDGLEDITSAEERIVFTDSLFFTPELLKEFVTRCRALGRPAVGALKRGLTTSRSIVNAQDVDKHPDRVEYGLYYAPAGASLAQREPVVIDPDEFSESFRMPEHISPGGDYPVPVTSKSMVQVDHWANLWMANMASVLRRAALLLKSPKSMLMLALRARSTNRWKVASKANKVGKNCDIHPTAYIELCAIGDNVQIGAGAVLRNAVVGSDSVICNNATIELAVLGKNSCIRNDCIVQYSVLYPGVLSMARLISLSMVGRDSFFGDNVTLTDFRLDSSTMRVVKDGALVDSEAILLGSCVGHEVYLGSGIIVAPGREVPNGLRLAGSAERIVGKFNADGDIPGGRLVKAGRPIADVPVGSS